MFPFNRLTVLTELGNQLIRRLAELDLAPHFLNAIRDNKPIMATVNASRPNRHNVLKL